MSADIDAAEEVALPQAPPTVAQRGFRRAHIFIAVAIIGLAVVPRIFGDFGFFLGQVAAVYAMLGLSVTVVTGYAGLISLMPFSFAGIGAVISALAMANWGWPFWLAVPLAALATLPVSILVGVASVRLKGLYLAIATLTFSNALGETFFRWDAAVGGRSGWVVSRPKLGPLSFQSDLAFYLLCLGTVLLLVWMLEGLRTSRLGRAMLAVRDNELEAQALGVNVYKTKLAAFVLSGMVAGLAGAYLATLNAQVSPSGFQSPFAELSSFLLVTAVVIGGIDRAWGAFFGATVLTVQTQIAAGATKAFAFLGMYTAFGLILFLLLRPGGLIQVFKIQREKFKTRPGFTIMETGIGLAINVGIAILFLTVLK